jgi:hypothetical protein
LHNDVYLEYVTNTPATYGGSLRPEKIGKELFQDKFSGNIKFTRRKLNSEETRLFKATLRSNKKLRQFQNF